ncbi:MAG: hypothetical protein IJD39_10630 [Clostridia bacterium]|nr:hypothetical protein [Clostridia bacterium]
MKCPHCGHWNRASFPRCFRCGMELPQEERQMPAGPAPEPSSKIYIQINEEGKSTSPRDDRDTLAAEMKELAARKKQGEVAQRRLRQEGTLQGFAPTGRTVQTLSGRSIYHTAQSTSYSSDAAKVEGEVRPDAIPVLSSNPIEYSEFGDEMPRQRAAGMTMRQMKVRRRFGMRRYTRIIAIILLAGALCFGGYKLYQHFSDQNKGPILQDVVSITPSIYYDMPAHLIKIPGEEGQIIWISELRKNIPVVGGYASIEVPDYTWYEDQVHITEDTATAVLTPYLKTSAGEQKPMGKITYQVDIPLSPLELVTPSTNFQEVSTQMYQIEFSVAAGSTVTINDETLTDLVNTNQGLITYQASVAPIGNNEIVITARAPYCRENSITLTLYRHPQQIRLDLAADTGNTWRPGWVDDTTKEPDEKGKYPQEEQKMTIRGTTVSWATIRVLSDHRNLDLTNLSKDGTFSFEAIFRQIGTNTIIIEASAPGYETSVVRHDVYYVPVADIYSRKAWDMDQNYTDYLNNMERRVANTQIYQCVGEIIEIKSDKPQMAVLKLDSNYDRTALIRNYTNDTWKVGERYKIFADAFSTYDGAPWLNGRYSYIQQPK